MDRPYEYLRSMVVSFQPRTCCCIIPIRTGLIVAGYFNIVVAVISLLCTANDSFPPTIVKVQQDISEENTSKTAPVLIYTTEIAFNMVLLCGMYRKDVVLLRAYLIYSVGAVIISLLFYSTVSAEGFVQVAIILSTAFQVYVLLLVRCMISQMESSRKNGYAPAIAMSSLTPEDKPTPSKYFVEFEKVSAKKAKDQTGKETKPVKKTVDIGQTSVDITNSTDTENKPAANDNKTTETEKILTINTDDISETKDQPINTDKSVSTMKRFFTSDKKPVESKKKSADTEIQSDSKKPLDAEKNTAVEKKADSAEKPVPAKKRFFSREKKSLDKKKKGEESKNECMDVKGTDSGAGADSATNDVKLETVNEDPKE